MIRKIVIILATFAVPLYFVYLLCVASDIVSVRSELEVERDLLAHEQVEAYWRLGKMQELEELLAHEVVLRKELSLHSKEAALQYEATLSR